MPRDSSRGLVKANEALHLRIHGDPETKQALTWKQIAERCKYASPGAARNAALRPVMRQVSDNVQEYQAEAVARIEGLLDIYMPLAMAGDHKAFDRVMLGIRQLSDIVGMKHSDGIAARKMALEEAQTLALFGFLQIALDRAGLDEADRKRVEQEAAKHMREIAIEATATEKDDEA